jgi:hypothetical protein
MAETNTAQIQLAINAQVTGTQGPATLTGAVQNSALLNLLLTSGVAAAGKISQIFAQTYAIVNGAAQDLDLYALGGGNDLVGAAYTNAVLKVLIIQNLGVTSTPAEADYLTIGGDTTTAACTSILGTNADSIKLPGPATALLTPTFMLCVPGATAYAVGASTTNHKLQLASGNSGKTINVNVIILGATS